MRRITSRFVLLIATAAMLPLDGLRVRLRLVAAQGHRRISQPRQPGRRRVRSPTRIQVYFDNSRRVLESIGTELRGTQLAQWQQERVLRNHVLDFPEFREISVFDGGGPAARHEPDGAIRA